MTLREAYAVLEVDVGAPASEVRPARNVLLRVWHPDRHQHDETLKRKAEEKTTSINEAFRLIEQAGFPDAARVPLDEAPQAKSEDEARKIDQLLKMRELELREREIALQEKLAAKPSAGEWIDEKAKAATQVAGNFFKVAVIVISVVIALIIAIVALDGMITTQTPEDKRLTLAVVIGTLGGAGMWLVVQLAKRPRR